MQLITDNLAAILAVLLAISEGLAVIPSFKSNSIFQAIVGFLQKLVKPTEPPKAP